MGDFFRQLPKAELHLHLEGSVTPETLREIDPSISPAEVRSRYRYQDFRGFIDSYIWITSHLRGPDEYALALRRLVERLAADNVRYAEVNLSVGMLLWRGIPLGPIYDALAEEARRSPVELWFIFDAVRQFGAEHGMEVARLAAERTAGRVVAIGIGGDEGAGPAECFAGVFRFAKSHGLRVAPHAGETGGPESIWAALHAGADRIGHGIRAVEDPELLRYLRDRDIPLEICISSNVATGAVAALDRHPVRRLYDAGVPIVLNTDDPAMFSTTLSREYALAAQHFGFSRQELEAIAANSFRYAFKTPRPASRNQPPS